MKIIRNKKIQNFILGGILATLCLYVSFRAWNLSFTHDECLSYTIVQGNPQWTFTANHHILNTFLMRITSGIFGDSEFSFRLPNVIAFYIFLFYGYLFLKKSNNLFLMLTGVSLLLFNHFMIDFFSLARGYGLAMGLILASLSYLLQEKENGYPPQSILKDYFFSLLFAALALFANLSTINYFIPVLIIFTFQYIRSSLVQKDFNLKHHFIFSALLFTALIPLYFAAKKLLWLNEIQQLYFGLETLDKSISDVLKKSIFDFPLSWDITNLKYLIYAAFAAGIIFVALRRNLNDSLFKVTLLISLILSALISEHYLFAANYPPDRTITYLLPVFSIFLFQLLSVGIGYLKEKYQLVLSGMVSIVIVFPLARVFLFNMNTNSAYEWKFETHTRESMNILEKITGKADGKTQKYSISNDWIFEPSLNYYIREMNLNLEPADRDSVRLTTDFIYDFDGMHNLPGYQVLASFPDIKTTLYRRPESGPVYAKGN